MLFRRSLSFSLLAILLLATPFSAAPALAKDPSILAASLTQSIGVATTEASSRNLTPADTQKLIEQEIEAAIIQSGEQPEDVLTALRALRNSQQTEPAKLALAAVTKRVADAVSTSKEAGEPSAVAASGGSPAFVLPPIISASGGGGGGGGSDYRVP